ncbi:hypothetical protein E2C01_015639 [Portunus trituberculatus]|uniref:Uncharacterized protein n=1 Tax=Portunus trituberculatus TaxID=210409 RepID=A0A5B7DMD9_PORTR|nr:hypothetical protein [Portunus trituberculatus]
MLFNSIYVVFDPVLVCTDAGFDWTCCGGLVLCWVVFSYYADYQVLWIGCGWSGVVYPRNPSLANLPCSSSSKTPSLRCVFDYSTQKQDGPSLGEWIGGWKVRKLSVSSSANINKPDTIKEKD